MKSISFLYINNYQLEEIMEVKSSFITATKDIISKNKLNKKYAKPVREEPLKLLKSNLFKWKDIPCSRERFNIIKMPNNPQANI